MKKIIILAALVTGLSFSAFSAERPEIFLDGNFYGLFNFNLNPPSGTSYEFQSAIGSDASATFKFSKLWGLHASAGYQYPLINKTDDAYVTQSNYDSWYSFSTFLGPVISPVKTEHSMFSVIPGFSLTYSENKYSSFGWGTSRNFIKIETGEYTLNTVKIGAGLKFKYDFIFSNGLYLTSGLETVLNFYNWSSLESENETILLKPYAHYKKTTATTSDSESCADLAVKPFIGIGYRFK